MQTASVELPPGFAALVREFPSLHGAPEEPRAFESWLETSGLGECAMHAAAFLLEHIGGDVAFDADEALLVWDEAHRTAFHRCLARLAV
jgi:hypothetical protein